MEEKTRSEPVLSLLEGEKEGFRLEDGAAEKKGGTVQSADGKERGGKKKRRAD